MYGNLPDQEFIRKMYGLPQETHPERLFVLNEIKEPGAIIYDMGSSVRKTAPNVMGVDIEPVSDIKGDIQSLPIIKSDSADFIISRHSLEHVIDPVKALYEWRRILKPSGKILIILPDHGAFDTLHPSLAQGAHLHAYTKESFKSLVDVLPGFELEKEPIDVVDGWSFGSVIKVEKEKNEESICLTLKKISRNIRDRDHFNFVRVGDGEIQCMLGYSGFNCDHQSYGPRLQKALKESLSFLEKETDNTFFSRWKLDGPEQVAISTLEKELGIRCAEDHDLLMHRVGEITSDHYELWKTIKESPRRKVFVGPDRLSGVMQFLNVDVMIVVPQHEAFDRVFDPEVLDDDIWLFSAGLASKAWIGEVVGKNKKVTCIDTGSAFDPIFVGRTRTCQLPQEYLKAYYKDLLN